MKISRIYKNKGISLNSALRKFTHGKSIVKMFYQLSLKKVDAQSLINWTAVGQLS